jgi:hypothetical protein
MPNPAVTQNFMLFCICKPHTRLTGKIMIARSIRMAKASTTIQRFSYDLVLAAFPWALTRYRSLYSDPVWRFATKDRSRFDGCQ